MPKVTCGACGVAHAASCFSPFLSASPSQADLIGAFTCHECGATYMVAFEVEMFMKWWNAEKQAAEQAEQKERLLTEQRLRSQLGRDVAAFRRQLESIETVNDLEVAWK